MGALFKAQYKTGVFVCMLKITDIHKKKNSEIFIFLDRYVWR